MGFLVVNNKFSNEANDFKLIKVVNGFYVYISGKATFHESDELFILIQGYVQPRNEYYQCYKDYSGPKLISVLFDKHGDRFIDYIKGIFTVVIIKYETIQLFTDHFGLSGCFICHKKAFTAISDSINSFRYLGIVFEPDIPSLCIKSLLHRIPAGQTAFKNISRSQPGAQIIISGESIKKSQYWKADILLDYSENCIDSYSFKDFSEIIKTSFKNFTEYLKPDQHAITLTGGKDSRTGLAALKASGLEPFGFTYGNPASRDAVYARKLADVIKMSHYIFSPPDTENYYQDITNEILGFGNPDISLHRAHRLYAFKGMSAILNKKSAYYAGYMAGEFLMGVYYDNLVFTKYLTDFWDTSVKSSVVPLLDNYFHQKGITYAAEIINKLNELQTFNSSLTLKERQFHSLFEIGIPHHSQDIFLAGKYFDFVYPFFIDIDFLETLFKSRFSLFHSDNKASNLISRYELYEFNLNIQHILYPEMDIVPFGKRGSYNTEEFLKGKYYWATFKALRYLAQRSKYPDTYNYGEVYRKFLFEHLEALNREKEHLLHDIYNIPKSISVLRTITLNTGEGEMHRYSNIIQLYLQLKYWS